MLSRIFPKGHRIEGYETDFEKKVKRRDKIHTMRAVGKWPQRIKEVQDGNALLSVREWTGKPYNSPQKELFKLFAMDGVGIEYCKRKNENFFIIQNQPYPLPSEFDIKNSITLAAKDGLTKDDFLSWFRKVEPGSEMVIIHFTKFRYV